MHAFFKTLGITALSLLSGSLLQAQRSVAYSQINFGGSLEPRPHHESRSGQVTIYGGAAFGLQGFVDRWRCIASDPSRGGSLVPLLFHKISETEFVLKGMGSGRPGGPGTNGVSYDAEWNSPAVDPDDTFGFSDRSAFNPESGTQVIQTFGRNSGFVDFDYSPSGGWYFTAEEAFELVPGQMFRLHGVTDGNVVALHEDPFGGREYSIQVTAQGTKADVPFIDYGVQISWPSVLNTPYQVWWTRTPDDLTSLQMLGSSVFFGDGRTIAVMDGGGAGKSYSVFPDPGPVSVATGVQIKWLSRPGHRYQVEWSPGLRGPWQALGPPVPGSGLLDSVLHPDPPGGQTFYRLGRYVGFR